MLSFTPTKSNEIRKRLILTLFVRNFLEVKVVKYNVQKSGQNLNMKTPWKENDMDFI